MKYGKGCVKDNVQVSSTETLSGSKACILKHNKTYTIVILEIPCMIMR